MTRDNQNRDFRSTTREAMRRAIENDLRPRGGGKLFNLPADKKVKSWEGPKGNETYYLDILPYVVSIPNHPFVKQGDLWYRNDVYVHWGIGPTKSWYVCPLTVNKRCPICEHREELRKEGADEKIIKDLYFKRKQIFNLDAKCIDEKSNLETLLWMHNLDNFGKLLAKILGRKSEEFRDFFLLQNGYTLKVDFEEKKFAGAKNPYYNALTIEFLERDPYPESILKETVDLDKVLNILPYEELRSIFLNVEEEDLPSEPEDRSFDADREHRQERTTAPTETPQRRRAPVTTEAAAPTPTPTPSEVETSIPQRRRTQREEPKVDEKNPCPFGHRFGTDNELTKDCPNCGDEWEACMKEKKANETKR